jgi:hypothetical protein
MDGASDDPYFTLGALIAHEYTHTVQDSNWQGNQNCRTGIDSDGKAHCFMAAMANQGFSPCWLFEGVPQANGRTAVASSYSDYLKLRQGIPFGWGVTTITDYKEASLYEYLYNQSAPSCYQNGKLYLLGYSLGFLLPKHSLQSEVLNLRWPCTQWVQKAKTSLLHLKVYME